MNPVRRPNTDLVSSVPGVAPIPRALSRDTLRHGARALARRDADLAGILRRVGDPPVWGRRPGFATLIRIILEQQVSLSAARTLYRRLQTHLGEVTPDTVHELQPAGLRRFGLTRQKSGYCFGLAERILAGTLDLGTVARSPDADGRAMLLAVPGLGPWSVDVYYLMALRRPDVWPNGDLALAVALREVKRLRSLPSQKQQQTLAES